ncbi:MAG: glycosyltransferase family 4 protein, partial [Deltaproteobacteria bacterium]
MNILLINHYAGSSAHGMEYRPYYLAREWVRAGHQVTIAAASYCHYRTQTMPMESNVQEQHIDGIRYVWLKTPQYNGNGVRRVLNMVTFLMQLSAHTHKLIETGKPELVIASSTYCLDILPAYRIARRYGAKLVFDVRDLWPLTPVLLGEMPRWHPYVFTLQMAEDFAYRHSDIVVSVLKKADSYMQSRGMDREKFVFIPNGIDPDEWRQNKVILPLQHRRELSRLRSEGRFIIGYAGSQGLSNALDTFIDAASLVAGEPVALVLVGQGPEQANLQSKASEAGLKHVVFLPSVPRQAIPCLLDSMDALYIGWRKEPLYQLGIGANKLLDYMMAGKPVI